MAIGFTLSDTSSLEDMSNIVVQSAIANTEPAGPLPSLVSTYSVGQGEKQVNLPFWGRVTAAALTEGVDMMSPEQMSTTVATMTATEHGVFTFVSDRLKRQNNENVLAAVGVMQGNAMGRLMDGDIIGLFGSVTKTVGTTSADNQLNDLTGSISYISTDNNTAYGPAPGGINVVIHPEQLRRIIEAAVPLSSGVMASTTPAGISEDILKRYWRGRDPLFGMPIYQDGNIANGATTTGIAFNELAFALAVALQVEAKDQEDITMRGTEIVSVAEWGEYLNVDPWAVRVIGDGTAHS